MYIVYHTHILDGLWKKTMDYPNCSCYSGSSGVSFLLSDSVFFFLMWLHEVFTAMHRFTLVAISRGYSLFAVHELLIAEASLIAEHGLQACELSSCSSRALEHRLSSFGIGT